jgi:transposase
LDRGVEHYRIHPKAISNCEFIEFLEELASLMGERSIAVFMDNMRVHRSRESTKTFERQGIQPVFNVPYSPQFNGIEGVFSMIKARYKQMQLQHLVEEKRFQVATLIKSAIVQLEKEKIGRCIARAIS